MEPLKYQNTGKNTSIESDRGSWWKSTIKETPIPGTYETHDLLYDLNSVPVNKTYGFKSSGRKIRADPSLCGEYLMPGIYNIKNDLNSNLKKKRITYGFKNTDRNNKHNVCIGVQDKDILQSDISPIKYGKEIDLVEKSPSTHASFKSQSSRFPTIHFKPKQGPSPTEYETKEFKSVSVTSPFISSTPRFKKVHVLKTPGPGAYTKLLQYPMIRKHIHNVGRHHGLFYPPGV